MFSGRGDGFIKGPGDRSIFGDHLAVVTGPDGEGHFVSVESFVVKLTDVFDLFKAGIEGHVAVVVENSVRGISVFFFNDN